MDTRYYILDEQGEPTPCADLHAWAEWMENHHRRQLAVTDVGGLFFVSTVFLGIDHRFYGDGPPVLWETMTFTSETNQPLGEQWRYASKAKALNGHARAVNIAERWLQETAARKAQE